jgi:hypothetical protein
MARKLVGGALPRQFTWLAHLPVTDLIAPKFAQSFNYSANFVEEGRRFKKSSWRRFISRRVVPRQLKKT